MKFKNSNGQWQTVKVKNYGIEQTPIGSMIYYPSQTIPQGYLVCDGREVLIADYPLLFNAIGYVGGKDVDTGYFRLPDMRGTVPAGYYEGLDSSPLAGNFGDTIGDSTHTLTVDEMPSHQHELSLADYGTDHCSAVKWETTTTGGKFKYSYDMLQATGGNQPHSIVQPTKLYHWLIKAKNVLTLGGQTEDFEIKGTLTMPKNRYMSEQGGAINMNNSDIAQVNSVYFNDAANSNDEGLMFAKTNAPLGTVDVENFDNLRVLDGVLLLNGKNAGNMMDCASFGLGAATTISKSSTWGGTQVPMKVIHYNYGNLFELKDDKIYCKSKAIIRVSFVFLANGATSSYYTLLGRNRKLWICRRKFSSKWACRKLLNRNRFFFNKCK